MFFPQVNLQVAGSGTTSHSLELNANNQDYDNNCQTFFAHFNCSTSADVPHTYAEKYVESHREGRGFQALLAPLSPYTSYTCSVLLYNVGGGSRLKTITGLTTVTLGYCKCTKETKWRTKLNNTSLLQFPINPRTFFSMRQRNIP